MSTQYPHKLQYIASNESIKDANGNWVTPSSSGTWSAASSLSNDCREEPENSGNSKVIVDGKEVIYTSMVYARKEVIDLKRGDKVRIMHNGSVKLESTVKRFSREKFHCLIWL